MPEDAEVITLSAQSFGIAGIVRAAAGVSRHPIMDAGFLTKA